MVQPLVLVEAETVGAGRVFGLLNEEVVEVAKVKALAPEGVLA